MASQQIVSTQPSTAFDRIPVERQIAQALPANSLSSFVLSSRNFYKCANPHLYCTLHFFGTSKSKKEAAKAAILRESCFGAHRAQSWLFHSDHSSLIRVDLATVRHLFFFWKIKINKSRFFLAAFIWKTHLVMAK